MTGSVATMTEEALESGAAHFPMHAFGGRVLGGRVATMAEEALQRSSGSLAIFDFARDAATAAERFWWQAIDRDLPVPKSGEQVVTVIWTDNALWFDANLRSLAVMDDVDSRNTAQSKWVRELEEVCLEAASQDWDGQGAAPLQLGAHEHALRLVSELAQGIRFPEVGVDPDGEISLGWQIHDDLFSVSVSGEGRLSYAGLLGTSECYGTEWMGEQVPTEVLHQLDRHISSLRASGRAD